MPLSAATSRTVTVHLRLTEDDLHQEVIRLVRAVTGSSEARLVHACRSCGSSDHGQPHVRTEAGLVQVSLSRAADGRAGVAAVCLDTPLGVDLEDADAASSSGVRAVVRHPGEVWATRSASTRLWVRKEALLKAFGFGLTTDPSSIQLAADGTVLSGPSATIVDVELGPRWVCSLAVIGEAKIEVVRH